MSTIDLRYSGPQMRTVAVTEPSILTCLDAGPTEAFVAASENNTGNYRLKAGDSMYAPIGTIVLELQARVALPDSAWARLELLKAPAPGV